MSNQIETERKETAKNCAKLLAELEHDSLIEISSEEFYREYEASKGQENCTPIDIRNLTDFPCEVVSFTTDGWDYFIYSYVFSVGWEGDKDCISYICKKKTWTKQEMNEILSIMYSK